MTIERIKAGLKLPEKRTYTTEDLLSSGCTLANLAASGKTKGAFLPGKTYHIVGDSASGKTFLSLTCFAEACKSERYKDYRLIFDDVEGGALMDLAAYFGEAAASKIEPPRGTVEEPEYSSTAKEFYYNLSDAIEDGRPFVYVLDSTDALADDADVEKSAENKANFRKGKEEKGTYGVGKAKTNSTNLGKYQKGLRDTESILILITQTRENMGFGFAEKTHSGGKALKFYSTLQFWSSVVKTYKKSIKGKDREIGSRVKLKFTKNRIQGKLRNVEVSLYHSAGFDDVGSNIDYLTDEKHWSAGDGINAKEFEVKMKREELVKYIEDNDLERKLQVLVAKVWNEIEKAAAVPRKKRYV